MNESMSLKCNSETDYFPNTCNVLDSIRVFQNGKGFKINPVTSFGVVYNKAGDFTEASLFTHSPFFPFS